MQTTRLLDMSTVPVPDSISLLDFEAALAELKNQLTSKHPDYADALQFESEPMTALLELLAYQRLAVEARINDAVKGTMLASAQGRDLEGIAVRYGLSRATGETDTRFRTRVQQVFEGLNTAGSLQAYQFHALNADPLVKDVHVISLRPCEIEVTILSHEGNGVPSKALLDKLHIYFGLTSDGKETLGTPSHVRPLGDRVFIRQAKTRLFEVKAQVQLAAGPSQAVLEKQLNAAMTRYLAVQHGLGKPITLLGLYTALNHTGVINAKLLEPRNDILTNADEVAVCSNLQISFSKESL
ncbi:baseplate J/gp47 family protein [Pseudoalteromonas xiamenensis]|uniref:baseplate assembly protein n=1 Tax=Pseudoalteromonas xiamenensis TaxID=882626 RepID=UPI0027E46BBF|nr:baseplate J/gp47 family protein [Pseudoalteromonas xiamenensis]WMN59288.1 baseplate J/gp47 family protein [Pseudoalteromonas xiamenensis]